MEITLAVHKRARKLLETIHSNQGKNLSQISKQAGVDTSKSYKYIQFFEEMNWIMTATAGNMKLITITDKGEDALICLAMLEDNEMPKGTKIIVY